MKVNNKHIKIFESNEISSAITNPLVKLKKVAIEASSLDNYVDGARMINDFIEKNLSDIEDSMTVANRTQYTINIADLIYPFYNRFGGEIIKSTLDDLETKDNDEYESDLPRDDQSETEDDLEIDF